MKTCLAVLGIALTAAPAHPAQAQTLLPAQSSIGFVTRQMGGTVEGSFSRWTAQIALDPKKPEAGRASFSVQTGSASFGAPETDAEVPKPAWFNVPQFPQANFQSTAIKSAGPGKLEVSGKLSIKGQTRDVVVPVALTQAGGVTTATGAFTIRRLDFKVGEGEWADTSLVADEVQVKFKLALQGVAAL
jgi:polyisoprenoid-binding protein YceI